MPQSTPDESRAAYEAMDDAQKLAVADLVKQGKSAREAVRLTKTTRAADAARIQSNVNDKLTPPSTADSALSAGLGAANAASQDVVPKVKAAWNASGALGKAALIASPGLMALAGPLLAGGAAAVGARDPGAAAGAALPGIGAVGGFADVLGRLYPEKYKEALAGDASTQAMEHAPSAYTLGHGAGEEFNAATAILAGGSSGAVKNVGADVSNAAGGAKKVAGIAAKGAAKNAAEKVVGKQALEAIDQASRGAPAGPVPNEANMAQEAWLKEIMPDPHGVAPADAAELVGTKPSTTKILQPIEESGLPPIANPKGAPPVPKTQRVRAVDILSAEPEVTPAQAATSLVRPPKITGTGEQLVQLVKNLPSGQRVEWIHRLAKDQGKDVARAVADAARVPLKLYPL